jgi:hypothetical protein
MRRSHGSQAPASSSESPPPPASSRPPSSASSPVACLACEAAFRKDCAILILAAAGGHSWLCLAPILIAHPSAWRQFGSHASSQFTATLSWALAHSWIYGKQYLLSAAAALVIGVVAMYIRPRAMWMRFAPAYAVVVVLGFVAAKSYYLWFVTPLLIAAACATASELREHRGMLIATLLAAMLYGGAVIGPVAAAAHRRHAPAVATTRNQTSPPSVRACRVAVSCSRRSSGARSRTTCNIARSSTPRFEDRKRRLRDRDRQRQRRAGVRADTPSPRTSTSSTTTCAATSRASSASRSAAAAGASACASTARAIA